MKMRTKLRTGYERLLGITPPGLSSEQMKSVFRVGCLLSFLVSLSFFYNLYHAYRVLWRYDVETDAWVLEEGAVMADFFSVLSYSLIGFLLLGAVMLSFSVYHYGYFRGGSRSVYLMKRLPRRGETARLSLTLPLVACLASLCLGGLLMLLDFIFYVWVTPNGCLPF